MLVIVKFHIGNGSGRFMKEIDELLALENIPKFVAWVRDERLKACEKKRTKEH